MAKTTTNNKPLQYRQGDVYLAPVSDARFAELMKAGNFSEREGTTLALGEATGHHHTFKGGDVTVYQEPVPSGTSVNNIGMLVEVKETSVLRHQEHAAITIPSGKYIRTIQREYTPEAVRNVYD